MRIMIHKKAIIQPINNIERLATELRKLRRARRMTQQELSNRAKIARRTITNAEGAKNMGVKELSRIANSLGYELVLRPKDSVLYEELATIFKDDE